MTADAVIRRDYQKVEELLEHCNGTYRNEKGRTVLHYYITEEITKILIKKTKVDVNSQDLYRHTPIQMWVLCPIYENGQIILKVYRKFP